MSSPLVQALRDACLSGEIVSPIVPERFQKGAWWPENAVWPEKLRPGVIESKKGYRFRPENLVLPKLLIGKHKQRVLDLGAGSGSLLLAAFYSTRALKGVGLELQEDVAERLARTLQAHDPSGKNLRAVRGDLRQESTQHKVIEALEGMADLIVTNPPFFPSGWGRQSASQTTHFSTHAEHGDVTEFLKAAWRILAPHGSVWIVYDAQRAADVLAAVSAVGGKIVQMCWIPDQRPDKGNQPFRLWTEVARSGPGASVKQC